MISPKEGSLVPYWTGELCPVAHHPQLPDTNQNRKPPRRPASSLPVPYLLQYLSNIFLSRRRPSHVCMFVLFPHG